MSCNLLLRKQWKTAAEGFGNPPDADIVPKRMPLSELIKRLRATEPGQNGMTHLHRVHHLLDEAMLAH